MAYHLHHKVEFFNCLNEKLLIELYKKDVVPDDVTVLLANSFSVQYPTGEGDKFDPIITKEAKLVLYLEETDAQDFDDFIVTFPDEWKMIAYDDGQMIFVGFLTPGEGRAEFQDKPYEVALSAIDGLGLLKGVPLTKDNGDKFTGVNLIIDYVLAILNKTGLDLDLRLFSNIVEESMQDRTQNTQADTFNQTGLHSRTFLKSATEFYDCYTCLERIMAEYFCVYQWNGMWVILRIGELQESVGVKIWHTDYDTTGAIINVGQSLDEPGAIGRDKLIHPVEVGQSIGSNFAIKSSRYTFNYSTWPEIPTNNKFERGTQFEQGDWVDENDFDGDHDTTEIIGTYKKFSIDDWEQGEVDVSDLPNPVITPIANKFYRRSNYNFFGVEEERYIVAESLDLPSGQSFWLRCGPVPVNKGSKIRLNISERFANDFSSGSSNTFTIACSVYIVADNGTVCYLDNRISGDVIPVGFWRINPPHVAGRIAIVYGPDQDTTEWNSATVDTPPIPFNGNLYIALEAEGPNTGGFIYFKDFSLEYFPCVAGGFAPVKADYAQTSQSANYKDTIDEEVFISDSPMKVLQGALYRENLTDLTSTTWHRYGVNEQRYFKELGELARFNNNYRRMWKIDGQFDGLKFTPANNATVIEPLSFHRQFSFPDSSKLAGRYFVLVPPLTLNYSEGRADMNFIEVLEDGSNDGNDTGDSHTPLQYIFA